MRAVDIIQKKKSGDANTKEEINFLIKGYMKGDVDDYQISAWLMAVCFNGLNVDETYYLTNAYVESGEILDFSDVSNHVADKHSTGGVGDKVTLVLIPLLASVGVYCAKLSGRGLGFTGGTIDKLESIPGFNCALSDIDFKNQLKSISCAISSQTPNLTPADGKTYALRDVTATVDNLSLICASVVSKKIASGANSIVLDVKYGAGAFMKTKEEALELSKLMIEIGKRFGRKLMATVTSMNQPLGKNIGNALEVIESIEFLKGNYEKDLYDVTLKIASMLVVSCGLAKNEVEALDILDNSLKSGLALEKLRQIINYQKGNENVIDDYSLFNVSKDIYELKAKKEGYINNLNAIKIAHACKLLGAGRDKKSDPIDFGVGISLEKKTGDFVNVGDTLLKIYGTKRLNEAIEIAKSAYEIGSSRGEIEPLIYKVIY